MIEAAATVLSPRGEEGALLVSLLEMSLIETSKYPSNLSSLFCFTVFHVKQNTCKSLSAFNVLKLLSQLSIESEMQTDVFVNNVSYIWP